MFLSHKQEDVKIAEEFKDCLELFGAQAFIAHRDIAPSAEGRRTMRRHLEELCNVFVPILTRRFRESDWTDQETGIAIARSLIIAPVRVDIDPYGFIDDRQAIRLSHSSPDSAYSTCLGLLKGIAKEYPRFREAVKRWLIQSLQGLS